MEEVKEKKGKSVHQEVLFSSSSIHHSEGTTLFHEVGEMREKGKLMDFINSKSWELSLYNQYK